MQQIGLGSAVGFQVLERVVAGRLWPAFALIEIGFRNAADRVLVANHARGENWFLETSSFSGSTLPFVSITGAGSLCRNDDPIAAAATFAGKQLTKPNISRDDLIAHLTMGFWIERCPSALAPQPETALWDLLLADLVPLALAQGVTQPAFSDTSAFHDAMVSLNRLRNRIAHHEPLIIHTRDVLTKRGQPKPELDLMRDLERAVSQFWRREKLALDAAKTIAPFATQQVDDIHTQLVQDLSPFERTLTTVHANLRAASVARKATAQAKFAAAATAAVNPAVMATPPAPPTPPSAPAGPTALTPPSGTTPTTNN